MLTSLLAIMAGEIEIVDGRAYIYSWASKKWAL